MHTQCDLGQGGPRSGWLLIVRWLLAVTTAQGSSVMVGSPFLVSGSLFFCSENLFKIPIHMTKMSSAGRSRACAALKVS